jgi:hypothetical protein
MTLFFVCFATAFVTAVITAVWRHADSDASWSVWPSDDWRDQ